MKNFFAKFGNPEKNEKRSAVISIIPAETPDDDIGEFIGDTPEQQEPQGDLLADTTPLTEEQRKLQRAQEQIRTLDEADQAESKRRIDRHARKRVYLEAGEALREKLRIAIKKIFELGVLENRHLQRVRAQSTSEEEKNIAIAKIKAFITKQREVLFENKAQWEAALIEHERRGGRKPVTQDDMNTRIGTRRVLRRKSGGKETRLNTVL